MNERRKLNVALVGAGQRGVRGHLPVITRLADVFTLVAICDRNEATARRVAEPYGVPAYSSVRDLVAHERVDIAIATVPADAHHVIAVFLANAGVNVLVETPMALTRPLADLMIEAAARNRTKLEVGENAYRTPSERFKAEVIRSGAIGRVSRLYRIFHEGSYHGMNTLRVLAGGLPVSMLGVAHRSDVLSHTDAGHRRPHQEEHWTLSVVEFDNGVLAVMPYSNVIHARSIGRAQQRIYEIDGTEGAIVDDAVHLVAPDAREKGGRSTPYVPQRTYAQVGGANVLQKIEIALPDRTVAWENPFRHYPLGGDPLPGDAQIAVADELLSLARAIWEDHAPDYGGAAGRLDQEMNLATHESVLRGSAIVRFPLPLPCRHEEQVHARFQAEYGRSPFDVEALVDTFFPPFGMPRG